MIFKKDILIGLASGLLCFSLWGQEPAEKDPAIPPFVAQKALQWMQHSDPAKRRAAYRTFQLYGDEGGEIYRRTLNRARRLHEEKLSRLIDNERSNPFAELPALGEFLDRERDRIYALINTDFKKDPDKIAMLRREMESLAELTAKARKMAERDETSFVESVEAIATALLEVTREVHVIDQDKDLAEDVDLQSALRDSFAGTTYLEIKSALTRFRRETSVLEAANADNEGCDWAKQPQKEFTRVLNEARSVLALGPLLLEEKLSEASTGHSRDMASLGFFAHQSPVPGKKSPADRARKAGFAHLCSGENIFMGSTSALAAYQAWFASDGHRFIMFARNPNLLGVGPHGKHWTMMTGSK